MQRDQFLDAQLWLRRVSAADWDALAVADDSEQLLPPLSTATSVVAWCCFHVGARLCVFAHSTEGDDDETQLKLELRSQPNRLAPPLLLARFDRRHAYAVDLRAVTAVVVPSQKPPQTEALPFGSLELPHVSVRIWIEPQHAEPATARLLLQQALLTVQQIALSVRQRLPASAEQSQITQQSSWRDVFRHSRYASIDSAALHVTTPAELLHRARTIFKRDADFEAVKVTCWQIVRAQRAAPTTNRRTPRASRADDVTVQPPSHLLDAPLAETDVALLLTELTHIFGDHHDGVNELLGFTRGDACHDHDQCVALRDDKRDDSTTSVAAACVTAKWQAWDAFLEASSFAPLTVGPRCVCRQESVGSRRSGPHSVLLVC